MLPISPRAEAGVAAAAVSPSIGISLASPSHWCPPSLPISSTNLPRLPDIYDSDIRRRAFAHKNAVASWGANAAPAYNHELDSYRPLEFVGDGVIRHLVGEALIRRYSELASNGLTHFRDCIVRNHTISHLSWHYKLQQSIIFGRVSSDVGPHPILESQDVLAEIFEAYVGGLCLERNEGMVEWITEIASPVVFPTLDQEVSAYIEASKLSISTRWKRKLERIDDTNPWKRRRLDPSVSCESLHTPPTPCDGFHWVDTQIGRSDWHASAYMNGILAGCGQANGKNLARNAAIARMAALLVTGPSLGERE